MKFIPFLATVIYGGVLYDENSEVELHRLVTGSQNTGSQNFGKNEISKPQNPEFFDEELFKYQLKDKVKIDGNCTEIGTDCKKENEVIIRELTAIICSREFLSDVIDGGVCQITSKYFCFEALKLFAVRG